MSNLSLATKQGQEICEKDNYFFVCVEPSTNGNAILSEDINFINTLGNMTILYSGTHICGLHRYEHNRRHVPTYKCVAINFKI